MKKIIVFCIAISSVLSGYSQEFIYDNNDKDKTLMTAPTTDVDTISAVSINPFLLEDYNAIMEYPNSYTMPNIRYTNPMGYSNMYMGMFNQNLYYSISGRTEIWPGITSINNASFGLHYTEDRFKFDVSADLWKYSDIGKAFGDLSVKADASYQLLPWLIVGLYGQYAMNAKSNVRDGSALSNPMVPFTGFGGYSRVMFSPNFGIEGSVGREFNPIKNKWEPTYGFGPVIEFKRKKRK